MRGYRWLDEGIEHTPDQEARAEALALKWSELEARREADYFDRLDALERGWDHEDDEEEEQEAMVRASHVAMNQKLEIEIVERMLAEIGARMMRPYEHWNEDERLMEYMERERD
jgi:hypothetical protein